MASLLAVEYSVILVLEYSAVDFRVSIYSTTALGVRMRLTPVCFIP